MLLLLLTVLDCRDCQNLTRRLILTGLCLSTAGFVLGTSPDMMQIPDGLRFLFYLSGAPSMAFIWLFGFLVFEDGFKVQRWHVAAALLYVIPAVIICFTVGGAWPETPSISIIALNVYGIFLMLHLGYIITSGYHNDLVIRRRRIRFLFIGGLLSVGIMSSLAHIQVLPFSEVAMGWFETIAIFTLTVWAFLWLTRLDEGELMFMPASVAALPATPSLQDPRDEALKSRLIMLMNEDQTYLEHGLTIRALAEKLKAPEHRLRHVINKGLGYRNFAGFLNHYRIGAIKAALADPEKANLPILTLAMDHGYNSLAPFNRAFREAEGMTPSEYRQSLI